MTKITTEFTPTTKNQTRFFPFPISNTGFLLQENGDFLLQENGDKLIFDEVLERSTTDFTPQSKGTTDFTKPSKQTTNFTPSSKATTNWSTA